MLNPEEAQGLATNSVERSQGGLPRRGDFFEMGFQG